MHDPCQSKLERVFDKLSANEQQLGHAAGARTLVVFGRDLVIQRTCGSVAMMSFDDLCNKVVSSNVMFVL